MVGGVRPAAFLGEEPRHLAALGVGVLDDQHPAGAQQPPCGDLQTADEVEAVLAGEERGLRVVALERGPWRTRETFAGDELAAVNRYDLWPDPILNPRTHRTSATEEATEQLFCPVPQMVGGGTVHWQGWLPRFTEDDFRFHTVVGDLPGPRSLDLSAVTISLAGLAALLMARGLHRRLKGAWAATVALLAGVTIIAGVHGDAVLAVATGALSLLLVPARPAA